MFTFFLKIKNLYRFKSLIMNYLKMKKCEPAVSSRGVFILLTTIWFSTEYNKCSVLLKEFNGYLIVTHKKKFIVAYRN